MASCTRAFHAWDIVTMEGGSILKTAEWFGGWLPMLMPGTMQRTLDETLTAWRQTIKVEAERMGR
jgi:hypothetical protein